MEIEYKWKCDYDIRYELEDKLKLEKELKYEFSLEKKYVMNSNYYDTENNDLSKKKIALRKRMENNKSIVCIKQPIINKDGLSQRYEYEIECDNLIDGVNKLKSENSLDNLFNEINLEKLRLSCEVNFTRHEYIVSITKKSEIVIAKLDYDKGVLKKQDKERDFSEVELEYVEGSLNLFYYLGRLLENYFNLSIEESSKLRRALEL